MPDTQLQIAFKGDIQELDTALRQSSSAGPKHTDDRAKSFKDRAKESKEAIKDLETAAQMADVDISQEMKSVLEEVPKIAKGISEVFSGGGVLAFITVLVEAGKALKDLYDEFILLKGAK